MIRQIPMLAIALCCAAAPAGAGGLARPNLISARGVGMGGAFTAVADDPAALHFNPAGAAWAAESLMLGLEIVYAPRSYTPVGEDGTMGPAQESSPFAPVPTLGLLVRLADADDVPSRVTFGAGIWSSHGGRLHYERGPAEVSAVNETMDLAMEIVAGGAYEVNDMLAIGAAVRLGLGVFAVDATARPANSDLSAMGVGIGATFGAMFRPIPAVTIGAVWRSPLTIETSGSGTVGLGEAIREVDAEHTQPWPQAASLGVAVRASPALRLSAQVDWTGWSSWEVLEIHFPQAPALNRDIPLDWNDTLGGRAGAAIVLSPRLDLRVGGYYESSAVPDRTIERIFLDSDKIGGSAGLTIRTAGAWSIDLALDACFVLARDVPSNATEAGGWTERTNVEPGEHQGQFFTFELAASRRL